MEKNISEMLDNAIVQNIEGLSNYYGPSSEEYTAAADNLVKLYELRNNEQKDREEKLFHYLTLGVQAMGVILPLICYGAWFRKGLIFEQEGTYTSTTVKNLLNRLRPTK